MGEVSVNGMKKLGAGSLRELGMSPTRCSAI